MTTVMKAFYAAFALFAFACLTVSPSARAISPAPDGCYPNYTTAEGCGALQSLTLGVGNTGLGWYSLYSDIGGSYNTSAGTGALALNNADSNTALGAAALLLNTSGTQNTAVGAGALVYNSSGTGDTAIGFLALEYDNAGYNTAVGYQALYNNDSSGFGEASENGAYGAGALYHNVDGFENTAVGNNALLINVSGNSNTAIGSRAGLDITGNGNVCIGQGVIGNASVNNRTWIRNVYSDVATARIVYMDFDGHLGTLSSSRRYKEQITSMDKTSETLFALRPVTFRYKKDVDPGQARSFGLIAEEVADVSPDLITRDKDGKPQTVRYDAVNAMLLNEFLKEHRTVQAQQKEIEALRAELKEQRVLIQKVNDKLELSRPAPQTVLSH